MNPESILSDFRGSCHLLAVFFYTINKLQNLQIIEL